MARKAHRFTDHHGRKGIVGDKVHSWFIDGSPLSQRREEAREVLSIWSWGARGTMLTLKGERMPVTASNCTIFREL